MIWQDHIPTDIAEVFEVFDHGHAAAILATEFPEHHQDICAALRNFRLTRSMIAEAGGNESRIPKLLSSLLRPRGWHERQLRVSQQVGETEADQEEVRHDTHKVDYIKGRVALDMEWNSKDQTFDRDLYAFRAFFEYQRISLGVLITRSADLNGLFREMGLMQKYGASTTHMGKLIPRLVAGRSGGCPVLVFGIRRAAVVDA
jgi:CRISPR-associated protein Csd2